MVTVRVMEWLIPEWQTSEMADLQIGGPKSEIYWSTWRLPYARIPGLRRANITHDYLSISLHYAAVMQLGYRHTL